MFIRTIGKHLGRNAKPRCFADDEKLRTRRRVQNQRWIEREYGIYDGACNMRRLRGHRVERAVWLDVLQPDPFGGGHARHSSDLIEHEILSFVRPDVQLSTAKAVEVRKSRMRPDGHSAASRKDQGASEDGWIAC